MENHIIDYGGNIVSNLDLIMKKTTFFSKKPYTYFIAKLQINDVLEIKNLKHGSIYLLKKDANTKINIKNTEIQQMDIGDSIQFQDREINISLLSGSVTFLVAGTEGMIDCNYEKLILNKNKDLYKVDKPWGYEIWINGEHPTYAFKKIYIKSGNKTSLQYHLYKQETNVLFEGRANLHFKNIKNIKNDDVTASEIDAVALGSISSIDVKPPTLHRIEALTDIVLYETSTPHLDDVIRVNDDTNRPDGRIVKEHKNE